MAGSGPPEIPGFDQIRLLGEGRFAEVHLFQQRFPRRLVAVKVLRDQFGWQSGHAFELEANALAALSTHPCIVAIHDAGRSAGLSYLVMEYCPLPSLAQQIRAGSLKVEDALRIGILVAGAVDTAHAHGILHRDIKPANILMTDYGAPQLADFGIATSAADRNLISGFTPAWAPPELIQDPARASVATDVYSLAATVYTMLAGHAPHELPGEANGVPEMVARAMSPVPRLSSPGVPPALADLLDQALSTDAHARFRSARQLGAALEDIERDLGLPHTRMVLVDPPRRGRDEQSSTMSAVATMWSEANERTLMEAPGSDRRPLRAIVVASALVLALVGGAAALAYTLIGNDTPKSGGPGQETPGTSLTSTTPSDSGARPLDLDATYANLPCTGEFIVGLGTQVGSAAGVEALRADIENIPDAKYLKNSESCAEFDPRTLEGDLYQAYLGPFDTFEDACARRTELQAEEPNPSAYRFWVKLVELGAKRRELCMCIPRPQDLPFLEVGQPQSVQIENRPFVSDLQHFLWTENVNNADPPVGDGWYDGDIAEMVSRWEDEEDIAVDGRVTPPVWERIKDAYCDDG